MSYCHSCVCWLVRNWASIALDSCRILWQLCPFSGLLSWELLCAAFVSVIGFPDDSSRRHWAVSNPSRFLSFNSEPILHICWLCLLGICSDHTSFGGNAGNETRQVVLLLEFTSFSISSTGILFLMCSWSTLCLSLCHRHPVKFASSAQLMMTTSLRYSRRNLLYCFFSFWAMREQCWPSLLHNKKFQFTDTAFPLQ